VGACRCDGTKQYPAIFFSASNNYLVKSADGSKEGSSGLDELEKELGISEDDSAWEVVNGSSTDPRRGLGRRQGCIPFAWICCCFADSVPPEYACILYDWAILNNQKYAGKIML
jgi:hypothetical protein